MSAAQRSIPADNGIRQLGAALVAVLLAVALLVALAYGQLIASQPTLAPAAGAAPIQFDRGWSSMSEPTVAAPQFDHGWSSMSQPTDSTPVGGGRGTRFAR